MKAPYESSHEGVDSSGQGSPVLFSNTKQDFKGPDSPEGPEKDFEKISAD